MSTAVEEAQQQTLSTLVKSGRREPYSYIVALRDGYDGNTVASELIANFTLAYPNSAQQINATHFFNNRVFNIFGMATTEHWIPTVLEHPGVKYVEEDGIFNAEYSWGLDRIDQREPVFVTNRDFRPAGTGEGSGVYIFDTGIETEHSEFNGRAHHAFDAISPDDPITYDCYQEGHGTRVAGVVAGSLFGVAKKADVYSVRVLKCDGFGTTLSILKGLEYVILNGQQSSVILMALSGPPSRTFDEAITKVVDTFQFPIIVASGNQGVDACFRSPANSNKTITVAATDFRDRITYFANYGSCVDILAPGDNIFSACTPLDDIDPICTTSGTSIAAAFTAGTAAIALSNEVSPTELKSYLLTASTTGHLHKLNLSPDKLLYTSDELIVEQVPIIIEIDEAPILPNEPQTPVDTVTKQDAVFPWVKYVIDYLNDNPDFNGGFQYSVL